MKDGDKLIRYLNMKGCGEMLLVGTIICKLDEKYWRNYVRANRN